MRVQIGISTYGVLFACFLTGAGPGCVTEPVSVENPPESETNPAVADTATSTDSNVADPAESDATDEATQTDVETDSVTSSTWPGPGGGRCEFGAEVQMTVGIEPVGIGVERCPDGSYHRYQAVDCGPIPEVTEIPEEAFGLCADCPEGEVCLMSGWTLPSCFHLCSSDDDCPADEACLCRFEVPSVSSTYGTRNPYSQCVPAECRTDADCAPYRCGLVPGGCGDAAGLKCHSEQDRCEGPKQCPPDDSYGTIDISPMDNRLCTSTFYSDQNDWKCTLESLCD